MDHEERHMLMESTERAVHDALQAYVSARWNYGGNIVRDWIAYCDCLQRFWNQSPLLPRKKRKRGYGR